MRHLPLAILAGSCYLFAAAPAAVAGDSIEVKVHEVSEKGTEASVGTVTLVEHDHGVLIRPELKGLEPGLHGFHLHQNPDCGPSSKDGKVTPGGAAGGHYDPKDKKSHQGPYSDDGHLGDLPALFVNGDGHATHPVLAPRLELSDFHDRAVVVHQGGDNYSDEPEALGGGGARVACGVIRP
ncbi:superoxide dismutase, Cu-Zn family [Marinobacter daqiaonensis]|uniref:Superoxide dismutase [Cu-Zn] n=1 Tax=Marinobacter daqiaonensis TaxID=650891 RepID=A0A1I6GPM9_9GAMM|nr:superoxide dismutase family protein [Marinobacter daqiaonensis]SFR44205.1 superoxide dismutase, Cu-Zn family [Marinobacter daqiaonensis]